jgi:aminopeptidase N
VEDRKDYGLPPLVFTASTDSSYHLVDYETVVSTAHDQQAVTVGRLLRSWSQGNRQFFHYKTEQPVAFMFAVSSARYKLQQETYKGIAFSIYHHPGHLYNVPLMMQAMQDAVDYGNAHFSTYPFNYLTLAEIPHYPGSATAYPGVVFSTERLNFMTDFRDSTLFNTVYATTAHEVAHQWWANALMPLDAPGRAMLTESLAKYTEAMVAEKRFGQSCLSDYLKYDNSLYFNMRNGDGMDELPLWQTAGQSFVHYQKGGLALYAIKEALGEERMNAALHQLIKEHAVPHHKASAANLFNALANGATAHERLLLDQLLKQVVVYSNQVKVLDCERLPNGKYSVNIQVGISKTNQTQLPAVSVMPDEDMMVAIYNQPANKRGLYSNPIYWQVHHFNKASSVVTLVTDSKPVAVAIDPLCYFLDDNLSDNVAVLK